METCGIRIYWWVRTLTGALAVTVAVRVTCAH
jgi:hypothetical protein